MKNLKRLRKRAGLTPTELATRADVNIAVVFRMEAGQQPNALYDTVVRLARALGVTPDELYGPVPRRRRPRPALELSPSNGG